MWTWLTTGTILFCYVLTPPPIVQSKAFMHEINISAVCYPPPFNFYCRSLDLIKEEIGDVDVGDNRYNIILLCSPPPPKPKAKLFCMK